MGKKMLNLIHYTVDQVNYNKSHSAALLNFISKIITQSDSDSLQLHVKFTEIHEPLLI